MVVSGMKEILLRVILGGIVVRRLILVNDDLSKCRGDRANYRGGSQAQRDEGSLHGYNEGS